MDDAIIRARFADARVATLATVRAESAPHLVPCCFVLDGDTVLTAVDAKPKSTQALRRLDNVRADGHVSLLVHHYADDWSQLWWVRVDGVAAVLDDGQPSQSAAAARARKLLAEKYEQYRAQPPPGPVIAVTVNEWRAWP